ncbi:MAG TPA: hypothetical protein VHJ39_13260 [Solirubrobacteraceae bacterium]|nr:hypothetical protein [Solirubrobacteraceae bacterium]
MLAAVGAALGRQRVLLDGELVCFADDGMPDFARLQVSAATAFIHADRSPARFLAFEGLSRD